MLKDILNHDELKLVTEKSMLLANKKDIVLPSTYRFVFSAIAKKNNVDIGAENIYTNEEINEDVYKHVLSIDNNANRAITAIENKDAAELKSVLEDTKKLKKEIEALKQIAYEDTLTKALNRKWLEENYINQESETFTKDGILVFVDLNDFKYINDKFGHPVGDKVLIHMAARFKQLDADVIRYGGDEFVLIFHDDNLESVEHLIYIIREQNLKRRYKVFENELQIKFAYGIAPFKIDDNFTDIINQADTAMYEDKTKVKERIS